jgi:hypothetical protein
MLCVSAKERGKIARREWRRERRQDEDGQTACGDARQHCLVAEQASRHLTEDVSVLAMSDFPNESARRMNVAARVHAGHKCLVEAVVSTLMSLFQQRRRRCRAPRAGDEPANCVKLPR